MNAHAVGAAAPTRAESVCAREREQFIRARVGHITCPMAVASFKLNAALTPAQAIERLTADDPTLTTCTLTNNAVLQMKGPELVPKIALALEKNTKCTELNMGGCGLTDALVAHIASALAKNTGLVNVNLEENKIGNDGATSLAKGIENNRTLMQLNLFGQKGTKFGDATLHAVGTPRPRAIAVPLI